MNDYRNFIKGKHKTIQDSGFSVPASWLSPFLADWQAVLVEWALRKGRAALFEECGMGKTLQQLAWADAVCRYTNGNVLILAPLAVARQTVAEGAKFGIEVNYARDAGQVRPGITVTNYERMHLFDSSGFAGVALDESSILKALYGKTKTRLVDAFSRTPYRLCCTATPAPNDYVELGNHVEFLGIMSTMEMLSRWFINDGFESGKWRLKRHAADDFWDWASTWAISAYTPSDVGEYDDSGFVLPERRVFEHHVAVENEYCSNGMLINMHRGSASHIKKEMRNSIGARVERAAGLVGDMDGDDCVVWCELNEESTALCRAIPGAREITGSMDLDRKEALLDAFSSGDLAVLVTKPRIAGFGLNWQHCRNMIFVGCSYSFEARYQAVRRCWRFGQTRTVHDHVVMAGREAMIFAAVKEKERKFMDMRSNLAGAFRRAAYSISGKGAMRTYQGSEISLPRFLHGRAV